MYYFIYYVDLDTKYQWWNFFTMVFDEEEAIRIQEYYEYECGIPCLVSRAWEEKFNV